MHLNDGVYLPTPLDMDFPSAPFELSSKYKPTGDQPAAIDTLAENLRAGVPAQTLLGVTGSGKTFSMA
ncbi:MAG: hypothetical protein K2H64_00210, partial [Desulfovibrio sp.]|nr:hypothetical protein [Desulfovibrio sp.]